MATLQEMLQYCNNDFQLAEKTAKEKMIENPEGILDLNLLYAAQGKYNLIDYDLTDKMAGINNPRAIFSKASNYLRQGDLHRGLQCLEAGRLIRNFGNDPWAPIDKLFRHQHNQTVVLYCEAGLGDEIIGIRAASWLKTEWNANVIVACNPSLMHLFKQVDGVSTCIDRFHVNYQQITFDSWLPAMSAPYALFKTYDNVGYPFPIITLKEKNEAWKLMLNKNKLNIGIRWAGNPKYEHEQFRKFNPTLLFDVKDISDKIQLYSLQRDNDTVDLPRDIIDWQYMIREWTDTAQAIDALDMVITSDTSIAHLSASMGKPTCILVPIMPYYPYAYPGNHTSWYPDERIILFRQRRFGDWTETFEELKKYIKGQI